MTYHTPHIQEIFQMNEVRGHILAAPDPWIFGRRMLGGRTIKCADPKAIELAKAYVGHDLKISSYFTTGLVLYDSAIVRNYGDSSSTTLLELLKVYHELGMVFEGDQLIVSVYWAYIRKQYQIIPYALFGSPRVPYEFLKRMPKEEYIVTAGNADRPVCMNRPTTKNGLDGK
jgi:hypothetical protein